MIEFIGTGMQVVKPGDKLNFNTKGEKMDSEKEKAYNLSFRIENKIMELYSLGIDVRQIQIAKEVYDLLCKYDCDSVFDDYVKVEVKE